MLKYRCKRIFVVLFVIFFIFMHFLQRYFEDELPCGHFFYIAQANRTKIYPLQNFLSSLAYSGCKHILMIAAGIPVIENIVRSPLAAYK